MKSKLMNSIIAGTIITSAVALIQAPKIDNLFAETKQTVNSETERDSKDSLLLQKIKNQEQKSPEYITIAKRTVSKIGAGEVVKSEFKVSKEFWDSLPDNLTKKQFYQEIKKAPIEVLTIPLLKGIPVVHPDPITNQDLYNEFIGGCEEYIENSGKYPLDSDLIFTPNDQKTLEKILERELKTPISKQTDPWIGKKQTIYLFPPQSRIYLKNPNPSIEMKIKQDSKTHESYSKITNKTEKDVFKRFLQLTILTKDSTIPNYDGEKIKAPIDNFYEFYKNNK